MSGHWIHSFLNSKHELRPLSYQPTRNGLLVITESILRPNRRDFLFANLLSDMYCRFVPEQYSQFYTPTSFLLLLFDIYKKYIFFFVIFDFFDVYIYYDKIRSPIMNVRS